MLYGCNVTDASIAALSTLHSLSSLDLNQCAEVTDAGRRVDGSSAQDDCAQPAASEGRKERHAVHEAVCAAAGIHALRDMTSMSSLSLAHSQVTDEGLAHIRGACADHAPRWQRRAACCNILPHADGWRTSR